jgi:hypothetical protein
MCIVDARNPAEHVSRAFFDVLLHVTPTCIIGNVLRMTSTCSTTGSVELPAFTAATPPRVSCSVIAECCLAESAVQRTLELNLCAERTGWLFGTRPRQLFQAMHC